MNKVTLLGVKINRISLAELFSFLDQRTGCDEKSIITYVNVHTLNTAYETPWVRDFINRSQLSFCDGVGLQLAAVLTGQKLDHRFTPPDFMERICENAAQYGWRLFFLGAKQGVAERAAGKMMAMYPGLQTESHHGYFDRMIGGAENVAVVKQINRYHPDILVVGFGMPLQERWILDNINSLDVKIVFSAGALFDYLSGSLPRAPRWMTDHGFEWLGRLIVEPRRLWRRYLLGNPLFFVRLFAHHFLRMPLPE